MKKIAIAFVVFLILAFALFHAGLWAFKTRILTNRIDEIVKKEANHVSVGSVDISFLPFSQKIIVLDAAIKNDGAEVYSKNIEIYPDIFSTAYKIKFLDGIFVKDNKAKDIDHKIEFSADTQFTISQSQKVNNFLLKYSGSGYKLISNVAQQTAFEIQTKEGQVEIDFGNDFTYRSKSASSKIIDKDNNILFQEGPSFVEISFAEVGDVKNVKFNINIKDIEFFSRKKSQDNQGSQQAEENNSLSKVLSHSNFDSGKIGLILVGSSSLTKQSADQVNSGLFSIDLQNFEFSHQQYKIFLNGGVEGGLQDYLSAKIALTLRVENFDNVINFLVLDRIEKIGGSSPEASVGLQQLKDNMKIYVEVVKNLAAKNSKTTASILAFDIKKEKSELDVKINDAFYQEILLQIMALSIAKAVEGGEYNEEMFKQNHDAYGAPAQQKF